jgi:hypothetical protein
MTERPKWPLASIPDWFEFQSRFGSIPAPVGSVHSPIRLASIYETVCALAIFHQLERETVEASTPDVLWDMPRDARIGNPPHNGDLFRNSNDIAEHANPGPQPGIRQSMKGRR